MTKMKYIMEKTNLKSMSTIAIHKKIERKKMKIMNEQNDEKQYDKVKKCEEYEEAIKIIKQEEKRSIKPLDREYQVI